MNNNIKISILGKWWETSKEANIRFIRQTPYENGCWKNIIVTDNIDEADFFIIFEKDSEFSKKLPSNKKIFLQREPEVITPHEVFQKNQGLYLASFKNWYQASTWWVQKSYDELMVMKYPEKKKKLNAILSNKQNTYGQKLRVSFITKAIEAFPNSIDIYGMFNNKENNQPHSKYEKFDKFEKSVEYKYSFVAENSIQKNYFTEKLTDAYLSWCMPIYWGCPNIYDFFPKESIHLIDISKPDSVHEIYEIGNRPINNINIQAIEHARELILNKYNLWPTLHDIINNKINKSFIFKLFKKF